MRLKDLSSSGKTIPIYQISLQRKRLILILLLLPLLLLRLLRLLLEGCRASERLERVTRKTIFRGSYSESGYLIFIFIFIFTPQDYPGEGASQVRVQDQNISRMDEEDGEVELGYDKRSRGTIFIIVIVIISSLGLLFLFLVRDLIPDTKKTFMNAFEGCIFGAFFFSMILLATAGRSPDRKIWMRNFRVTVGMITLCLLFAAAVLAGVAVVN